jgi:hypothetical protein
MSCKPIQINEFDLERLKSFWLKQDITYTAKVNTWKNSRGNRTGECDIAKGYTR